jgi:hypothetical protein
MSDTGRIGTDFARELERALAESGSRPLEIARVVLDAPREQLSRPEGLREIAQAAARELRRRVGRE